jgi:hypothetical protein
VTWHLIGQGYGASTSTGRDRQHRRGRESTGIGPGGKEEEKAERGHVTASVVGSSLAYLDSFENLRSAGAVKEGAPAMEMPLWTDSVEYSKPAACRARVAAAELAPAPPGPALAR